MVTLLLLSVFFGVVTRRGDLIIEADFVGSRRSFFVVLLTLLVVELRFLFVVLLRLV